LIQHKEAGFLKSALTEEGKFFSNTEQFFAWFSKRKDAIKVNIAKIAFDDLVNWGFDDLNTNLVHSSGKFFSIEGISVQTNWGKVNNWSQPIINQPEIGYLGIIVKKIDGVLHFLMQAKIEPGNINFVQLSPTLQATKSNYTRVHKGNPPAYLEYFQKKDENKAVLLDQLQSEQGARFLKKRNRNIIIEVNDDIEVKDDFCWLTLGQIHKLLQYDNVVNMDTRTVISGIPFGGYDEKIIHLFDSINPLFASDKHFEADMLISAIENENHLHSIEEIISWFTGLKSKYELSVDKINLSDLENWIKTDDEIYHKDRKYFKVIAVKAEIESREVKSWTQPLIESAQEGIIAFVVKKINGVYHFLVQAKLEAGNLDVLELAPTVQCLTGNYRKASRENKPNFLDYVLDNQNNSERVKYISFQSEEGGRFYREQNKSIIIEAESDFDESVPENFIWMTLNQLKIFIQFNNYLNIQSRSLISAIKFI